MSSPTFDVFISHAGEQRQEAAVLHQQLADHSVSSFLDDNAVQAGLNFADTIEQAMNEATIGVFILSPEFISKTWPMKELFFFLEKYDQAIADQRTPPYMIPVFHSLIHARDLVEKYRDSFSDTFWARVNAGETAPERIVGALRRVGRFTGVVNRNGYAQLMRDTAEIISKIRSKELYYQALLEGSSEPKQIRVMLCGPYGVGKSSVARSLQQLPFVPNLESTQGIDIGGRVDKHEVGSSSALSFQVAAQQWQQEQAWRAVDDRTNSFPGVSDEVPDYWNNVINKGNSGEIQGPQAENTSTQQKQEHELDVFKVEGITLTLWDFAGQVAYHSMHQMFFRENCLYVLVLNLQEDSHTVDGSNRKNTEKDMLRDAQLWLNAIVSSAGPNIGLVVVGTHADHFRSETAAQARLQVLLKRLKERTCDIEWDQVVRHAEKVVVDNKNGVGLGNLRLTLTAASKKILRTQDKIPLRWLRLLEALEGMGLPTDHFCLPLDAIIRRASKMGFVQGKEVKTALAFFDQVGSIIYVAEEGLDQWVFPEPHRFAQCHQVNLGSQLRQAATLGAVKKPMGSLH